MKTTKRNLPKREIQSLYNYSKTDARSPETSTAGDTTTTCTTVITTTHFNKN
jgi:hypothetical protein